MRYFVNRNAPDDGDHEVHEATCSHLPAEDHRLDLGQFSTCYAAVREAKRHFPRSNGCFYCARACHMT
jgi:hypothetical protein